MTHIRAMMDAHPKGLNEFNKAVLAVFGTGLVEDHWHDSDESANLEVLVNGAVTLACFWDGLSRME